MGFFLSTGRQRSNLLNVFYKTTATLAVILLGQFASAIFLTLLSGSSAGVGAGWVKGSVI